MSCGWGIKVGMVRVWVAGKTVCPLVTHWPYLSTLEMLYDKALHKLMFTLLTIALKFYLRLVTMKFVDDDDDLILIFYNWS